MVRCAANQFLSIFKVLSITFPRHTKRIILGNTEKNLQLDFESGTEVYRSCGATLNGQFWLIGGTIQSRQVHLITICLPLSLKQGFNLFLR